MRSSIPIEPSISDAPRGSYAQFGGDQYCCGDVRTILHWHDLRHEGASRLLADGVDIRIIQLMLGHASVHQTQRYLNVTDEELRKGLEVSWKRGRALRLVARSQDGVTECHTSVTRGLKIWRARQDSNLWPSAPEADALSS
jgi:hypothetical protein